MGDVADHSADAVTRRLVLHRPVLTDLRDLFELYRDPRVWGPDPLTRHTSDEQTERMINNWRSAWQRDGLGMWVARSSEPALSGAFVGIGGCFVKSAVAWNLGFRLQPRFWGRGYAHEISVTGIEAALWRRPDLPITASVLEGNERSQRTTESVGLRLVWRGPDAGNPDPHAVRLLYADRPLTDRVTRLLTAD